MIYGDDNPYTGYSHKSHKNSKTPRSHTVGGPPTRQSSYTKYTRTKHTKGGTKIKTTTEKGSYTETVTNYSKLKKSTPYVPFAAMAASIWSPFSEGSGGVICLPGHGTHGVTAGKQQKVPYTPGGMYS